MISNKKTGSYTESNRISTEPNRVSTEPNYVVTLQVGADEKRFDEVCCTVHASDSNDAKMKALGKISVFGYKFVRIVDANPQVVHRKSRETD